MEDFVIKSHKHTHTHTHTYAVIKLSIEHKSSAELKLVFMLSRFNRFPGEQGYNLVDQKFG